MKAYIQCSTITHLPLNENFYKAYLGFYAMGHEIVFFEKIKELENANREDIVVADGIIIEQYFAKIGIDLPSLDYPDDLKDFYGRKIWRDKLSHINNHPELWPVFMKSVKMKEITGGVIRDFQDLRGAGIGDTNKDVYCSEVITIEAEWRCFVRYGKILDIKSYKGDYFNYNYDFNVVKDCIKNYVNAPAGYAIDFGVTKEGKTIVVEVNDGYALGNYGLLYYDYAKLLYARWAELTGVEDICNF